MEAQNGEKIKSYYDDVMNLCSVEPGTWKLMLRAQNPIKAGEEITIQYISFMYGNVRRKRDIRWVSGNQLLNFQGHTVD